MKAIYMSCGNRMMFGSGFLGDFVRYTREDEEIKAGGINYKVWENVFSENFSKKYEIDENFRSKAYESFTNMAHEKETYTSIDKYAKELKEVASYMNKINEVQKECWFNIIYGIMCLGVSYNDMNSISEMSKKDGLYGNLIKDGIEKLNFDDVDVVFLNIMSNYDLLNAMYISKYIKKINDKIHICVARHSYENYTFHHFKDEIENNHIFWSNIDSVIENEAEREEMILRVLDNLKEKNEVKGFVNINNTIDVNVERKINDKHHQRSNKGVFCDMASFRITERGCHWNRCAFCTHKTKHNENCKEDEEMNYKKAVDRIKWLYDSGYKNFLFGDEAVKPYEIEKFSNMIIESKMNINWMYRSRFDSTYNQEHAKVMQKAGCREVIFGIESFSEDVLEKMEKYKKIPTLSEIKSVIDVFDKNKIRTHMNMIVGFPGETIEDYEKTENSLLEILKEYKRVTYTLNIFGLMKGSKVVNNPKKYNIEIQQKNENLRYMFDYTDLNENSSKDEIQKRVWFTNLKAAEHIGLGSYVEDQNFYNLMFMYLNSSHGVRIKDNTL